MPKFIKTYTKFDPKNPNPADQQASTRQGWHVRNKSNGHGGSSLSPNERSGTGRKSIEFFKKDRHQEKQVSASVRASLISL